LERQYRYRRAVRQRECGVTAGWILSEDAVLPNTPDAHRVSNILESLSAHILKGALYLAPNLPVRIVGNADTARLGDPFESYRYIDPITKDIIFSNDNITDVNADAKVDAFVRRHIDILFCHGPLDFVGTSHSVDHAGELNE